jgi:hypothetical protein
MKSSAHLPTVTIGARNRGAAKIAWISLVVAALLLGAWKASGSLDIPLMEAIRMSPFDSGRISAAHRVSLDVQALSHPVDQGQRFSVAHPLPAEVTASQRYSIGADARLAFASFGDAALRDLTSRRRVRRTVLRSNGIMLMLMLARLHPRRY